SHLPDPRSADAMTNPTSGRSPSGTSPSSTCIHEPTNREHACSQVRRTGMTPTTTKSERELAHRASDGLEVSLYWNEGTNRVTVRVYDARSDEGFEIDVG